MHEWAADRYDFVQYPEPEWRVQRRRKPGKRLDQAFNLTLAGFAIWPIIAPVLLGALVVVVMMLG